MSNNAFRRQKNRFDAHRQYHRMYFKANDMDFVFQWLMGSAAHGGAGIGESFQAAAQRGAWTVSKELRRRKF